MTKTLNPDQLSAITHGTGPLLIIAGAGTGKTTVITERIKYLITEQLAKPEEILALTFTDKAAVEMETRVDQLLPLGYNQMWITTFHSFCDRILRAESLHIGLASDYQLLSTVSAVQLFKKNLFKLPLDYFRPLGNPTKFITAILTHISRLQDENISPKEYLAWAKEPQNRELALCYELYEQLKIDNSFMDFGNLITNCLTLFTTRPKILAAYQQQFKYILVDEYQDTNVAQNQLLKLLASHNGNLTVVADDDQAIYRFRGAAVGNVLKFREDYQPTLVILTKNYRSRQYILDAAYKFISHNNPDRLEIAAGIDKKLIAVRPDKPGKIEVLHANSGLDEADLVANKISQLLSTEHLVLSTTASIAILVRANSHAEPFIQALTRHGIAYQFLGPTYLYSQPEIKKLISYLRVLVDPTDTQSLFHFLSSGNSQLDLIKLLATTRTTHAPLFDLLDASTKAQFDFSLQISPSQKIYNYLESSGQLKAMLEPDSEISESMAKNIATFLTRLKTYESENPDTTVPDILAWLDLSTQIGESPLIGTTDYAPDDQSVKILTVHSSKGLEFPVVFLVSLVSDRFPTRNRSEDLPIPAELIKDSRPELDFHLQEERRLFYVGLTRARDQLFLSYSDYYGEGKRIKKPSPFIAETLGQVDHPPIQPSTHSTTQPSRSKATNHEPLTVNYLTFSHIDTFLVCPLHYKAKYILGLPTPPSPSLSLGNSIHKTLKNFSQNPTDITKLLEKNWILEGYTTKQHRDQSFAKASKFLTDFVKLYPKIQPIHVEYAFKFPLSPDLTIGGRFDRIDRLPNGSLHIIDYKTSAKPKTQKDADKDLQLSIYALAATKIFNLAHTKIQLSFYFFETQSFVTTTRTQAQLNQAAQEILSIRDQIQSSDFTCSNSMLCKTCEYLTLCDQR